MLFAWGVKSCRDAQKEQAHKDYVRDVGAFVGESEDQSKALFGLLEEGGQSPVELQNTVNGYASEAAQLVDRAKDADHPGELDGAHALPDRDARVPPRRPARDRRATCRARSATAASRRPRTSPRRCRTS